MKKTPIYTLLLFLSALLLNGQNLKVADSIIYTVPDGWDHVDSKRELMPNLGVLTSVVLEDKSAQQTLTVSVLSVDELVSGVQYSTELIEATLSPWVEAYREKGSHYYPRKILGRRDFIFYSQDVGRLKSKKVELRGVLLKHGDDWVNFFCMGPREISWEQYAKLMQATQLLKAK